jgi:hypothetical protein
MHFYSGPPMHLLSGVDRKKCSSVPDLPTGPKQPTSTVLLIEEEAIVVASLLPLDDCLYALQPTTPHLTRSSLHRIASLSAPSATTATRHGHAGLQPE